MNLELGDIEETMFYGSGDREVDYEIHQQGSNDLTDFCIDMQGRVRPGLGIVNMGSEDNDLSLVPGDGYGIEQQPWNSHSNYVEMALPNPAENVELYHLVRKAMIDEFSRRLKRQIKNAKARLSRKAP
jgi:hypothetical protein